MVYRVTPLTYLLGKPRVKVPYFAMVNLIAGIQVVPELVQQDFTAEKVVTHLRPLLEGGRARAEMIGGLAEVKAALQGGHQDGTHAADRASKIVFSMLDKSPQR